MKGNRKFKILSRVMLAVVLPFMLAGCSAGGSQSQPSKIHYETITSKQAKKIIDTETGYIILDVRTQDEFDQGHIENAVLIPDYEIEESAAEMLTDKNQLILIYCRSGRRSAEAAQKLQKLGYTNVKDFGGIIDWQYETVK